MNRALFYLTLLLSLLLPQSLPAETGTRNGTPPWYEFEVLVFERINKGAGSTELWSDDPGTPPLLNVIPFDTRGKGTLMNHLPIPYRPLPAGERKLGGVWSRLRGSRNYRPLYHIAWRQQVVGPDAAQAVYLHLPPQNGGAAGPGNPPQLEGTLKISVKRYLHLQADLLLRRLRDRGETAQNDATAPYDLGPAFTAYRLQAQRRLRRGKLHLLDHPVLGVLIQAERYAPPKPDPLLETPGPAGGATPPAGSAPADGKPPAAAVEPAPG